MHIKNVRGEHRFFGSMTVSPRGQVVIPANARKELGLDTGATLLVLEAPFGEGLILLKAAALEQMLTMMSEHVTELEKQLKRYKSPKAAKEERG